MAPRLPLLVVGGFLGAGKTTLINRWLNESSDLPVKVAVLVNDFGAINIDSALIASRGGDVVALTNGCVCCSIGGDLSRALIRVLEADALPDAIVVEASGVSDPWRIAQIAAAEPQLALAGVLVLVDASMAAQHSTDLLLADTLVQQLKSADLVVLNKLHLADSSAALAAGAWVREHVPSTPCLRADASVVSLAALMDESVLPRTRPATVGPQGYRPAHATQFEGWSMRPHARFDVGLLRDRLAEMPAGVLRLKGIVRGSDDAWWEVQFAGRHLTIRKAPAPQDGIAGVVAIGLRRQLPQAALESLFS